MIVTPKYITPKHTMRESLANPKLLGHVLQGDSWYGWRVILIASAGEPLTDEERVVFKKLTGRSREPLRLVHTLVGIGGRRSGKSLAIAVFIAWISGLCSHPYLALAR